MVSWQQLTFLSFWSEAKKPRWWKDVKSMWSTHATSWELGRCLRVLDMIHEGCRNFMKFPGTTWPSRVDKLKQLYMMTAERCYCPNVFLVTATTFIRISHSQDLFLPNVHRKLVSLLDKNGVNSRDIDTSWHAQRVFEWLDVQWCSCTCLHMWLKPHLLVQVISFCSVQAILPKIIT